MDESDVFLAKNYARAIPVPFAARKSYHHTGYISSTPKTSRFIRSDTTTYQVYQGQCSTSLRSSVQLFTPQIIFLPFCRLHTD